MTIVLDHVAVRARDKHRSARFLADLLGRQPGEPTGPWASVPLADGLTVLFHETEPFAFGHLALRVDEATFDAAVATARAQHAPLGSSPGPTKDGRIANEGALRRVYIRDPDGNSFELIAATA